MVSELKLNRLCVNMECILKVEDELTESQNMLIGKNMQNKNQGFISMVI